ncbi:transporter substrate-binding domain-containing protein [Alicyclobacillus fastidiosus]|uniref:Transporter substrate-binding domain-containing protein n=1 Tax=Alicyclobacillus fastidiosus TaxID=392011 RepID=A0ABY6ZHN1_9BACL|nr:transporter substrate-binding domain-containing protein [Alicyclobacillus fastidiosus]WAH41736.1 transporter substrate-binding domain-containing protein [Alicyclobacillus fastidiosus]GMA63425.1 ABC transporter substrate-binding protein [Alicyclobacillus fastidiosus]
MQKLMKVCAAATAVALMTAVTGCGTSSTNSNTATSSSSSEPTLVLATSADYKPYEYHDTSSGQDKIVGFDIDVANAIAKQLHFKVQIEDMDFDGLIAALQAKRADFVIAGMTPTAARKKAVDFSDVYYQAENVVLTKKGHTVKTMNDLSGEKVAVQLGSVQETAAQSIPNVKLDSLDTIPTVVQEVLSNRADAAVIENTVATGYVKSNPQLQLNKIAGMTENGSAIAFPKGSPWTKKFDTAIEKMKQDGQLQQLANKWFGGTQ